MASGRYEMDIGKAAFAIKSALELYQDACGLEASASWDGGERWQEDADVAWNQYEGAKAVLALIFGITELQVDEDMEQLTSDETFNRGKLEYLPEDLKPCPFCGNKVVFLREDDSEGREYRLYHVECDFISGGCGASSGRYSSKGEAKYKWNARVYGQ